MSRASLSEEPTVPRGHRLSSLLRASVFVTDLDESLKLYRDILGLRVRRSMTLAGAAINRILGTRDKTVRIAILQSGDSLTGNVGLFCYADDTRPNPPRTELRTGDTALVFVTNDILSISAAVTQAGYAVVAEPMVLFPEADPADESLEMLFFDRDGVAINLIQRPRPAP